MTTTPVATNFRIVTVSKDGTRHTFENQSEDILKLSTERVCQGQGIVMADERKIVSFAPGDVKRLAVQGMEDKA